MTQCKNCLGSGLVGNGPVPSDHLGALHTCAPCRGTGTVADAHAPATPAAPEPKGIVATVVDAVKSAVSEAL